MKKFIVLMFVALMLAGCASMNVPNNATPEQKRAAACLDAKTWLATLDAGMQSVSTTSPEYKWYKALVPAAQVQVNSYCGAQ